MKKISREEFIKFIENIGFYTNNGLRYKLGKDIIVVFKYNYSLYLNDNHMWDEYDMNDMNPLDYFIKRNRSIKIKKILE